MSRLPLLGYGFLSRYKYMFMQGLYSWLAARVEPGNANRISAKLSYKTLTTKQMRRPVLRFKHVMLAGTPWPHILRGRGNFQDFSLLLQRRLLLAGSAKVSPRGWNSGGCDHHHRQDWHLHSPWGPISEPKFQVKGWHFSYNFNICSECAFVRSVTI